MEENCRGKTRAKGNAPKDKGFLFKYNVRRKQQKLLECKRNMMDAETISAVELQGFKYSQ